MFKYKRNIKKARLSIAPLLDMIFILLIFFVVSTTFSRLPGVNINRPDATVSDKLPPNNLIVGITTNGGFYVNKRLYTLDQLKDKVSIKALKNKNLNVVILADEDSAIKHSVAVMDLCRQLDINNISIAEEIKK
ncbi:MAG: biopolymer transporter ExbD [bacterium]|nr:biopolymer transporter ExbD [bacterium]